MSRHEDRPEFARWTRRQWVRRAATAAVLAPVLGCKRQRAPKVQEVWDTPPTDEATQALGSLAPRWPSPTRAVLESGLATFWLHEPDAPVMHARLLIPTVESDGESPSLAATSVVLEVIRNSLTRRLAALGVAVDVAHRPDRVEVVVHAHDDRGGTILAGLARALPPRTPTTALQRAQVQVAEGLRSVAPDQAAVATLASGLLRRPMVTQRASAAEVRALSPEAMDTAWQVLADPRRAVLVVHAGRSAQSMRDALRGLSDRWHGRGRRQLPETAVARLRGAAAPTAGQSRLLAAPAATISVTPSSNEGGPVLMLGRVVPTPSHDARSLARLAQRIVAEELDARLAIAGPHALFLVRVSLSSRDPEGSATTAVDTLSQLAQTRHPQQRLFAAAQLWLGARVVQASLDGEDWTALWSEAMDLADDDDAIAGALTRDAKSMLEPAADALTEWQTRWLDPRGGDGGWAWTVAGADDKTLRRLARIAPVQGLAE